MLQPKCFRNPPVVKKMCLAINVLLFPKHGVMIIIVTLQTLHINSAVTTESEVAVDTCLLYWAFSSLRDLTAMPFRSGEHWYIITCTVCVYVLLNLQIVYNDGCKCVHVIARRIVLIMCPLVVCHQAVSAAE